MECGADGVVDVIVGGLLDEERALMDGVGVVAGCEAVDNHVVAVGVVVVSGHAVADI